jgi:hypothetical protein
VSEAEMLQQLAERAGAENYLRLELRYDHHDREPRRWTVQATVLNDGDVNDWETGYGATPAEALQRAIEAPAHLDFVPVPPVSERLP